jgi:hypothetical protein
MITHQYKQALRFVSNEGLLVAFKHGELGNILCGHTLG